MSPDSNCFGFSKIQRFLVALLGAGLVSGAVHAQQIEVSASQALFEEARQLMLDNRPGDACPKFAESLRLDPELGTLLNLALCHEKQGKPATAYLEYRDAIAQAAREGESDRRALAEQRITALEPRVIRLTLRLEFPVPRGLWLKLDGTALEPAALGVALPVDPGAHAIEYGAPGLRSRQISLSLSERELRPALLLDELEPIPAPQPSPIKRPGPHTSKTTSSSTSTRSLGTGLLIGGGAAALAMGIFSGIKAGAEWSKRNDHCRRNGCDQDAERYGQNAKDYARLPDISFALGLTAVAAGTYLFATRPREQPRVGLQLMATVRPVDTVIMLGGDL